MTAWIESIPSWVATHPGAISALLVAGLVLVVGIYAILKMHP